MILYLDTTTILRMLLRQESRLKAWGAWEAAYTSELSGVEARRTIDRLRLESVLDDEGVALAQQGLAALESGVGRIRLTRAVMERASLPMATTVKTLDALHLASAMIYRERTNQDVVFATHDRKQAVGALALGFEVVGTEV